MDIVVLGQTRRRQAFFTAAVEALHEIERGRDTQIVHICWYTVHFDMQET